MKDLFAFFSRDSDKNVKDMGKVLKDLSKTSDKTVIEKMMVGIKKVFGSKKDGSSIYSNYRDNIDDIILLVTRAKKKDSYIARASNNLIQNSLMNGISLSAEDQNLLKEIKKRFRQICIDSGYTMRGFLRESVKNYIDFSNVFIYKSYIKDKSGKKILKGLVVLPSFGWTVKSTIGNRVVEWEFDTGYEVKTYSNKDIVHLTYNKETHDVFGTPFITSVLEDVHLLRELEGAAIDDYFESKEKRTIFRVGSEKLPGTALQINETRKYLSELSDDEDIVINGMVNVELIQPKITDSKNLIENMKKRVNTGLSSSSTQMGESGSAGRQDAETQDKNTLITVKDIQENFEDEFTIKIMSEIVAELKGEFKVENFVSLRFGKDFTEQERIEKHFTHLFVQGVLDHEQTIKAIGKDELAKDFDIKKSYTKMYGSEGTESGEAENKSNPKNQHTEGTGTTKKTKKD